MIDIHWIKSDPKVASPLRKIPLSPLSFAFKFFQLDKYYLNVLTALVR
jgi:hypothetical protein